eukprot:tig00000197_g15692.t1
MAAAAPKTTPTALEMFEADLERDCLTAGGKAIVVDELDEVLVAAFGFSADEASDLAADNALNSSGEVNIMDKGEFIQCCLGLFDAGKLEAHEASYMPADPRGRPAREFLEEHAGEVFENHVQTFMPETLLQLLQAHKLSAEDAAETAKSFGNMFDSPDPDMTTSDGLISCDEYKKAMLYLFEEESYFPHYHELAAAEAAKANPPKPAAAAAPAPVAEVSKAVEEGPQPPAPQDAVKVAQRAGIVKLSSAISKQLAAAISLQEEWAEDVHTATYSDEMPSIHCDCSAEADEEILLEDFSRVSFSEDSML